MSSFGLTLIFYVLLVPVVFLVVGLLYSAAKPRKNIIIGTTVPYGAQTDPDVLKICRSYKKSLIIAGGVLLLLSAAVFFINRFTVVTLYLIIWLYAAMAAPFFLFVIYNGKMRALKEEKGWKSTNEGKTMVDVKAAVQEYPKVSGWWFLPPFLISLVPVVLAAKAAQVNWVFFWVLLFFAALVPMFYFFYRLIFRQKAETVDDNTQLNQALTRVRRYQWSKCWVLAAWITGLFNLSFGIFIEKPWPLFIAVAIYSFAILFVTMRAEFKTRKAQNALMPQTGTSGYSDDDMHWIGGILYYNPNDAHLMANERVGVGITVNMAKPAAKIIAVLVVLCLLAGVVLVGYGVFMDYTPVTLEIKGDTLVAAHMSEKYVIPLGEITDVKMLDSLPPRVRKNGTGTDNVNKGHFYSSEIGDCYLCLNPESPPYIMLEYSGEIYILGDSDAEKTQEIFAAVSAG